MVAEKPFDIDETSEVTDSGDGVDLDAAEYIRNVRWREINRGLRAIRMVELPAPTRPLTGFRFFGIVGTWMEEDIISASVSNAFHQGCEKVFLVDNCSSDQTVENAVSSGATLAHSYRTESFDERLRIELMNTIMQEVTEREGAAYTWWLWFDADEFPHGPEGDPLKSYLALLDARYRVVGARYFHHFPSSLPHYLPPYHPIHFQPLCYYEQYRMGACSHRKHPLIRIDRDRPPVIMHEGFHRCDSSEVLLEPSSPAFIHHFPFRAHEVTLRRMIALCGADGTNTSRIQRQDSYEIACYGEPSHSSQRFALFEVVYSGNWDLVAQETSTGPYSHEVKLQAWTDTFSGWEVDVWYSKEELLEAVRRWQKQ
jgi:hypothetical protein